MDEKKTLEIISTVPLTEGQQNRIRGLGKHIRLTVSPGKAPTDLPKDAWEKAEVLFADGKQLPTREQAPALKWVQTALAGVDRALAQPLASDPEIVITSASGVMVSQMGEYVLMALLILGHKLSETIALQKERKWGSNTSRSLQPVELRGSTVGIVGYGSIGREVARLLLPLGVNILAAKRDLMRLEDSGYTPEGLGDPGGQYFKRLYPIEGLKGMLKDCDFVVLTLPLTPETKLLFSAEMFEAMKPGAYLVNVSRGDLIDEAALIQAIKAGKVGGAVLDVFAQEPLPAESPLWSLPEVIITPHTSGISSRLMDDVVSLFIENLRRYQEKQPLYNIVDTASGY